MNHQPSVATAHLTHIEHVDHVDHTDEDDDHSEEVTNSIEETAELNKDQTEAEVAGKI